MSSPEPEAGRRALDANVLGQDHRSLDRYLAGAPHLKYQRLTQAYHRMVEGALKATSKPPSSLSVCELGAGLGLSATPWLERQIPLTAVDPSRVMLENFQHTAAAAALKIVVSDAETFLSQTHERYDILCCVSMLHHIPDYLTMLEAAQRVIRPGGCLITFQDPLQYNRMARGVHRVDRFFYFLWRSRQGELRQGLRTRWRRLRRRYDSAETADFEEYHVVRNGVDSQSIVDLLRPRFEQVIETRYWSNQSLIGQVIGDRVGLKNTFAILATGAH